MKILQNTNFIALSELPNFKNISLELYGTGNAHLPKHYLKQVHSNRHLHIDEDTPAAPVGDAASTNKKNTPISIRTADCLPILLWDKDYIGGIHAGWKGLSSGIIQNTLPSYTPHETRIVIGPSIGPCCFEVGQDVMAAFEMQFERDEFSLCTTKGSRDRWHLDLASLAVFILSRSGCAPENIYVIRECTHHNEAWNSYRAMGPSTQHNWSVINRI